MQPIRSLIARYRALPWWLADPLLAAVLLVEGVIEILAFATLDASETALALALVSLLANYVPARRAAAVPPVEVIRRQ